jgi:hypothetical protein
LVATRVAMMEGRMAVTSESQRVVELDYEMAIWKVEDSADLMATRMVA